MQVEATKNEGLTRQFSVTIPAQDIETKVTARLNEIGATVSMPGFRPGKVPLQILKKQYGPSVIGEVLEREISETSAEAIKDNNLRPAMQPRVEIVGFEEGSDLTYTMTLELMPEFEQPDFKKIKLERLVVDVTDDMASEALARIAEEQKAYDTVSDDRPSTAADALLVDFTGTIDGTEFPGGSAKDFQLELSSQNFIPGFIDQMVGVKAGEAREIKVTFPDDYGAAELAGKEATFSVTVKELRAPKAVEVNDELAKGMGLESLDAMKAAVKERLASEYGSIARMRLKRGLLDHMAGEATFEVPGGMVEREFQQIWSSITGKPPATDHDHDHDHEGHDHDHGEAQPTDPMAEARFRQLLEESGKDEDELKDEYRTIAERRVRLGLLLAEVGRSNNIQVADEELNRAVVNEARRFPGQERQVVEFYQKDPAVLEQLRAPIFEDKVVDFIIELAGISERKVSADELMAEPDDDDDGLAPAAKAEGKNKNKKKKAAAKPAPSTKKKKSKG